MSGDFIVIHQNAGKIIEAERFPLVDQNQKGGQQMKTS